MARQLGCTVAELGSRITAREYAEQAEFYRIEPCGEEAMDARFARLMSLVATALGSKRATPSVFMPDYGREQDRDPVRQIRVLRATMQGLAMRAERDRGRK